jgi:DNA polymerase-4
MLGGESASRSMSAETTFERDTAQRSGIEAVLMGLADELSYRLWNEGLRSRCLVLKLRLHDFTTLSRRATRPTWYRTAEETWRDALALLDRAWDGRTEIRLVGLGFTNLQEGEGGDQGELFSDGSERRRRAETTVFEIERKGLGRVTRARLMDGAGRSRRGAPAEGRKPAEPPDAPGTRRRDG